MLHLLYMLEVCNCLNYYTRAVKKLYWPDSDRYRTETLGLSSVQFVVKLKIRLGAAPAGLVQICIIRYKN